MPVNCECFGFRRALTASLPWDVVPFETIVGDLAFGPDGEWTEARPIFVQYHGIKSNDLDQFRDDSRITILSPPQFKTGELIWPYDKARGAQ